MLCFLSYAICLLYLRREDKIAAVVLFGFLLFLFSFVVWITKEIMLRKYAHEDITYLIYKNKAAHTVIDTVNVILLVAACAICALCIIKYGVMDEPHKMTNRVLVFLSIAMHLDYTACKEMKMVCIEPMNEDSISENAHLIHSSQESEDK